MLKRILQTVTILAYCCVYIGCAEATIGNADNGSGDAPANAQPGKCYAKSMAADGSGRSWQEVLCGDKVTASVIRQVQTNLTAAGYNVPVSEVMNKDAKEALMRYQKDHNLPVGNLDIRTLDALGVKR